MSSLFEFDPDRVEGSGNITRGTAGQALGNRNIVYLGADGNWYLADADTAATMPVIGITRHAIRAGGQGQILLEGYIGLNTWTWTTGGEIYASTTAGQLTQTAPTPPDYVQIMGIARSATMIYFTPMPPSEEMAAAITKEEYYPPVESDAYIGQHYGAQMLDNTDTIVGFEFAVPGNFHNLISAYVIVLQITAATPNMVWSATTDWAEACSTENYNANQDATGSQTSLVTQNDLVCLNISSALTGIAAGDLVGMEFLRDGDNAADTVGGTVLCLGLRLRYR